VRERGDGESDFELDGHIQGKEKGIIQTPSQFVEGGRVKRTVLTAVW